jgi:hypothetical protein
VKKWIFILLAAAALLCHAQDLGTGMEISGFRVPVYDDDGQLQAQLYGEFAKVLEDDEVDITNLKIEMYKDGKVAMTGFLPQCFFNTETRFAKSDGQVLIESESMTVTGRGFVWAFDGGRIEILHESKVLVKESATAGMKELEL